MAWKNIFKFVSETKGNLENITESEKSVLADLHTQLLRERQNNEDLKKAEDHLLNLISKLEEALQTLEKIYEQIRVQLHDHKIAGSTEKIFFNDKIKESTKEFNSKFDEFMDLHNNLYQYYTKFYMKEEKKHFDIFHAISHDVGESRRRIMAFNELAKEVRKITGYTLRSEDYKWHTEDITDENIKEIRDRSKK